MKYFNRVKPLLYGQVAGLMFINILFAIKRFNTMGFYEALGRSVFATSLGLFLLAMGLLMGIGIIALMDKNNRE